MDQPYYSFGNEKEPEVLVMACHGYGQTAESFMEWFSRVDCPSALFLFPEGLSRFYKRGMQGEVGSSWMTRMHREIDIDNQNNYLDALLTKVQGNYHGNLKVLAFGFSQGCATISRWFDHTRLPVHGLVLWSSVFPPDLTPGFFTEKINKTIARIYFGEEDPYYKEGERKEWMEKIEKLPTVSVKTFKGGHEIPPKELDAALEELLHVLM